MRRWLLLALVVAGAACGDDTTAAPVDAGRDSSIGCDPTTPTCVNASCGSPCDSSKDTWCTNHECFEPYVCQCAGDHWLCDVAGRSCDMASRPPQDLGPSD